MQLRTRGIWRLKNCEIPPMRMNFARATSVGTPFWGLDMPKLTSVCRDDDMYEQYILQEVQLYRIQNLLTPISHKPRLVNITYVDSANGKVFAKRAAIMLEEPIEMANRIGGMEVKLKGARADDLDPFHSAFAGMFQYFIGNTDWSISGLHNMELLSQLDGTVIPIPWDYDFSGAIKRALCDGRSHPDCHSRQGSPIQRLLRTAGGISQDRGSLQGEKECDLRPLR